MHGHLFHAMRRELGGCATLRDVYGTWPVICCRTSQYPLVWRLFFTNAITIGAFLSPSVDWNRNSGVQSHADGLRTQFLADQVHLTRRVRSWILERRVSAGAPRSRIVGACAVDRAGTRRSRGTKWRQSIAGRSVAACGQAWDPAAVV